MKRKAKYLRNVPKYQKVLGEFSNEFGEEYVVVKDEALDMILVAGDETDWETLIYMGNRRLANPFILSEEEENDLLKIIMKNK